jgi:hypothetical protein
MPTKLPISEIKDSVESKQLLIHASVHSGADPSDIDNIFYQLIFSLPSESTCITRNRLLVDRKELSLKKKQRKTGDHIYRPRLWAKAIRENPELVKDFDTFWPIANELRTVCRCLTNENERVKEDLSQTRSTTRNVYANCGIITYKWKTNYKQTKEIRAFHDVPDFMDDIERNVLGWT